MEDNKTSSRRKFIKSSGAIAGITVIPSKSVWGACNASGVSGGSQALESVCQISKEDDPEETITVGGFPASDYRTLFTSLNAKSLPDASARGVVGALFTKTEWLGISFDFPVFRNTGNGGVNNRSADCQNLISNKGIVKRSNVKSDLSNLPKTDDNADDNDVSSVDPSDIKRVLNSSTDWHMNELLLVRKKLMDLADENLRYVSGIDEYGKAITDEFNVLESIINGNGAMLQVSALYLNLVAGFSQGVPIVYTPKQYCEHLISVMLEHAYSPAVIENWVTKVSSRFSSPSPKKINEFL